MLRCQVPIPSYLIALAVGALEARELGPRSRVWSEPSMVEAGAYEFAETEDFIKAGAGPPPPPPTLYPSRVCASCLLGPG